MIRLFIFLLLVALLQTAVAQTDKAIELNKVMLPYMNANEPGGVVLVAKKGEVIYKKAFGMANMELDVPVNDSMLFYIGSNTKQFTAVAILQLVEKGRLSLKDTIGKFISSCPYPVSGITMEKLLSHVSGLGSNNETPAYRLIDRKGLTPVELVNYFINLPMDFPAGTKWVYNNANFYILGYLIEKLTGASYGAYVTENIFKPAGMLNTHVNKEVAIIKNRAAGYLNFRLGIQNTRITTVESLYSSGAIQSTVEDMLKWNRALNAGKLLQPATLQYAYTPQTLKNGKLTGYGMGFHVQELHGSRAFRHGGLVEGFTSETLYLPAEDVFVVMLLNEETFKIPIVPLVRILAGIAIDKPYRYTEVAISKTDRTKFMGVYANTGGELINIKEQNGSLTFQRPWGSPYPMHYGGNDEFFLDKDLIRADFTSDSAGKIKCLKTSQADIGLTEWFKTGRPVLNLASDRVPDSLLKQYAGSYLSADNDSIRISISGPALYYQVSSTPKQMLGAENNFRFFSLKEDFQVEFIKSATTNLMTLSYKEGSKIKYFIKL